MIKKILTVIVTLAIATYLSFLYIEWDSLYSIIIDNFKYKLFLIAAITIMVINALVVVAIKMQKVASNKRESKQY